MKRKKKILFFSICFAVIALPFGAIIWKSFGKIYTVESAPKKRVALVFGAGIFQGKPVTIFQDRLQTAADLYFLKKIEIILISGDNGNTNHNEPQVGKNFLKTIGIPEKDILLDYAGFRTFDTCARAKKIFSLDEAVLITQGYHLPRVIFVCQSFGMKVVGVSADRHSYNGMARYWLREQVAKIATFYEVILFPHDPYFLGTPEAI